jgi:hypothetical protein
MTQSQHIPFLEQGSYVQMQSSRFFSFLHSTKNTSLGNGECAGMIEQRKPAVKRRHHGRLANVWFFTDLIVRDITGPGGSFGLKHAAGRTTLKHRVS